MVTRNMRQILYFKNAPTMALLYAHKDYIRRTLTLYENWANKDSSWRWPSSIMRSHSTWRTLTLYGYPQINKLFQSMKIVNFHVRSGDAMKRTVLAFFSGWETTENRPVLSSKSRCSLHCKNKMLVGYKVFLKGLEYLNMNHGASHSFIEQVRIRCVIFIWIDLYWRMEPAYGTCFQ